MLAVQNSLASELRLPAGLLTPKRSPALRQTHPLPRRRLMELATNEIDTVYRMALHLSRDPDTAADLTQDTFVRAFRPGVKFCLSERGIRPWLFKILHNLFYSRFARHKLEMTAIDDLTDLPVEDSPQRDAHGDDLASINWELVDDRLKAAVDALPDSQRLVLLLWAVEGVKYHQIADLLGVALGTVMSRLFRARQTLAEQLAPLACERRLSTTRLHLTK